MGEPQTIRIGGAEYVIIPKADYLKLSERAGVPAGSVDAHEYMRASLGDSLKQAREHAKLTQAELAERMGKSQTMVSGAEGGRVKISERYVLARAQGVWPARRLEAGESAQGEAWSEGGVMPGAPSADIATRGTRAALRARVVEGQRRGPGRPQRRRARGRDQAARSTLVSDARCPQPRGHALSAATLGHELHARADDPQ